jgi:hypothetical protein
MRRKDITNVRAWERIHFTRVIEKEVRISEESNMFISINQNTHKMNKEERKEKKNSFKLSYRAIVIKTDM